MKARRKKKLFILTVSYLSAAAAALGALALVNSARVTALERTMDYHYRHAFEELVTSTEELSAALEKSCCATDPAMVNAVCTDVFGKAMTAQMSLGMLPRSGEGEARISDFISRVGDYAFALSRSAADGVCCTAEALENLAALSETAGVLSADLAELQSELADGTLRPAASGDRVAALLESAEAALPSLDERFRQIEQEFPELPSLIYDGPFSEHLTGLAPRALEGTEEVTQEFAREVAARALGIPKSKVCPAGECTGDLPCYCFTADGDRGSTSYVSVTKQSGALLSLLSSRPVGSAMVDAETALAAAAAYLDARGLDGMAETYHVIQGNVLTVNYAFRQDAVLCYSDLVKVSVALDTGTVCGYEARGYLTAHCIRELPQVSVSPEEAASAVPERLEILAVQTALVPSDGRQEVLCHEYKCAAADGRHYIIYVNAATGRQHKILILLEDASGALTL